MHKDEASSAHSLDVNRKATADVPAPAGDHDLKANALRTHERAVLTFPPLEALSAPF